MNNTKNFVSFFIESQTRWRHHSYLHTLLQEHYLYQLQPSIDFELVPEHHCHIHCLSLDAIENRFLLTGGVNGSITVCDIERYKVPSNGNERKQIRPLNTVLRNRSMISAVSWFPHDSGIFLSSSYDGSVLLYDTNQFTDVLRFSFEAPVHWMQFGQNTQFVVALDNGTIRLGDIVSGDFIHTIHGHTEAVTMVDWHPIDENLIVSASKDGSVKCWDLRKIGSSLPVLVLDWQQDHSFQLSGKEARKTPSYQGGRTAQRGHIARAHDAEAMSVRYSPDGKYILSSGNDLQTRLWHSSSASLVPRHFSVNKRSNLPFRIEFLHSRFNRDNMFLFPLDQRIAITPLLSGPGDPVSVLSGHFDDVTSVACRDVLSQLVSAGRDQLLLLWDNSSHRLQRELEEDDSNTSFASVNVILNNSVDALVSESARALRQPSSTFVLPIIRHYLLDAGMAAVDQCYISTPATNENPISVLEPAQTRAALPYSVLCCHYFWFSPFHSPADP